jgi:hypothetical protein
MGDKICPRRISGPKRRMEAEKMSYGEAYFVLVTNLFYLWFI